MRCLETIFYFYRVAYKRHKTVSLSLIKLPQTERIISFMSFKNQTITAYKCVKHKPQYHFLCGLYLFEHVI